MARLTHYAYDTAAEALADQKFAALIRERAATIAAREGRRRYNERDLDRAGNEIARERPAAYALTQSVISDAGRAQRRAAAMEPTDRTRAASTLNDSRSFAARARQLAEQRHGRGYSWAQLSIAGEDLRRSDRRARADQDRDDVNDPNPGVPKKDWDPGLGESEYAEEECQTCGGTGGVDGETCPDCGGSGKAADVDDEQEEKPKRDSEPKKARPRGRAVVRRMTWAAMRKMTPSQLTAAVTTGRITKAAWRKEMGRRSPGFRHLLPGEPIPH